MTQPAKSKNSPKELFVFILLVLVGVPIAWFWGARDGRAMAAAAYGEAVEADAGDDYDYDDYADEETAEIPAPGSALASTPEAIARGEALFKANCAACHGEKGDGKGPAAVAFTPAPRDFTDPAARWTLGREPAQIFAAVSNGIEGTGMAGFSGALTESQRWDLVHFIVSLGGAGGAR